MEQSLVLLENNATVWKDSLVVKSTGYSCRGPGFDSQHPQDGSQLSLTYHFQGDLCSDTHANKILTHNIKQNNAINDNSSFPKSLLSGSALGFARSP